MATAKSDRQRRYRERNRERLRQEELARRAREKLREVTALDPDPECGCCHERHLAFLRAHENRVRCLNCLHAETTFGLCPHRGIDRRLG